MLFILFYFIFILLYLITICLVTHQRFYFLLFFTFYLFICHFSLHTLQIVILPPLFHLFSLFSHFFHFFAFLHHFFETHIIPTQQHRLNILFLLQTTHHHNSLSTNHIASFSLYAPQGAVLATPSF